MLDEPTNDLDIPTLIALEEYLDDFGGALIVVSHDRYFLDRTIDNIFKFESNGHIREFAGNYSAYLERFDAEKASAESPAAIETALPQNLRPEQPRRQAQKLTFKRKQLETI